MLTEGIEGESVGVVVLPSEALGELDGVADGDATLTEAVESVGAAVLASEAPGELDGVAEGDAEEVGVESVGVVVLPPEAVVGVGPTVLRTGRAV